MFNVMSWSSIPKVLDLVECHHVKVSSLAVLLLGFGAGSAFAQDAEVEQTAKLSRTDVDDWVVECVDPPINETVSCQVTYTVLFGASRAPVFVSAIAVAAPDEPMKVLFALPLNIKLRSGLVISDETRNIMFQFDRCASDGCYAETPMTAELFELMTSSESGFATVVRDSGEAFRIPFSFKGFNEAVDLMNLSNSAVATSE